MRRSEYFQSNPPPFLYSTPSIAEPFYGKRETKKLAKDVSVSAFPYFARCVIAVKVFLVSNTSRSLSAENNGRIHEQRGAQQTLPMLFCNGDACTICSNEGEIFFGRIVFC